LGSEINVSPGGEGNNDRHEANLYLRLRVLRLSCKILRVDLIQKLPETLYLLVFPLSLWNLYPDLIQ
jgi:hypothetical protein